MKIVNSRCLRQARDDGIAENIFRFYSCQEGTAMTERVDEENESDYTSEKRQRFSTDNGRTWSEWQTEGPASYRQYPGFEVLDAETGSHTTDWYYNPVHRHEVRQGQEQIYRNGHRIALERRFLEPEAWALHSYLFIRKEDGTVTRQLVTYETGEEFDPDDPGKPAYYFRNSSYRCNNLVFDDNGDLLLAVGVPMRKCFELRKEDPRYLFPTEPDLDLYNGILLLRGRWNGEKYVFTPSRPIVISDLQTGRGMDEPTVALLSSGRIVIVTRGSNEIPFRHERSRLEPGTPGFKWYAFSDDGGRTFTDFMPWHFDSGEVIYSSATISLFLRSRKTGKQYWIGNIIPPEAAGTIKGNHPRFPLNIAEIDETYGVPVKKTAIVIDTRREGESEMVQLSNFYCYEDRETGYLHLILTKFCQHYPEKPIYCCETWEYEIETD